MLILLKLYLINQDYLYTIYFDQTNLIHPLDIEAAFLSRMETGRKLPGDVQKRQTCPVPLSSRGVHNLSSSIIYEGPSSDLSPSRPWLQVDCFSTFPPHLQERPGLCADTPHHYLRYSIRWPPSFHNFRFQLLFSLKITDYLKCQ